MSDISIFVGTVYGNAQSVAEQAESKLKDLGHNASIVDDPSVDDFNQAGEVLFITSTTGQGDLPPIIEFFVGDLRDSMPMLNGKRFGVVALGDSSYGDTFVGAGKDVFALCEELAGTPVAEMKVVDALDTYNPEEEVLPWIEEHYKS